VKYEDDMLVAVSYNNHGSVHSTLDHTLVACDVFSVLCHHNTFVGLYPCLSSFLTFFVDSYCEVF
jgi:hypothetical protein